MLKKIVLAPDSFKGTVSASQVCQAMAVAVKRICPNAVCEFAPMSDGGDGTIEAFSEFKGAQRVYVTVKGPLFDDTQCQYILLDDGKTAVIEMAEAAGLTLVEDRLNPMKATSYGVGEMIRHALSNGVKKIILSIGGSATNDGGVGMAVALGTRFFNGRNEEFFPLSENLSRIARIDNTVTSILLKGVDVMVMCDVANPLCGEKGASFVYGPQKGATEEMIKLLDDGLYNFGAVISDCLKVDILNLPGAGAGGGMGGGAAAFLNGDLVSGIDVMLDLTGFDKMLEGADVVITGEGKVDSQTAHGKAICGIAKRAKAKKIPVVVIAGDIGDADELYKMGVTAILSTNRIAATYKEQKKTAMENIVLTTETALRLLNT